MNKFPVYVKIIAILLVLFIVGSVIPPQRVKADAPTAYTFTTIATTGTITSLGGTAFSQALNVSGVPTNDYLFFTVVANFVNETNAYSSTIDLKFTNGATTTYYSNASATQGASGSTANTTLYWSGIFEREYTGGSNLTIHFTDVDTSAGGPYSSRLENVVVTIYPSPTTSTTFSPFNTGTLTSGGSAYNSSLDVSHVPADGYLFFTVTADWTAGTTDARSQYTYMELNNAGSTVYLPQNTPRQGGLNTNANTTLYWAGIFQREYIGYSTLNVKLFFYDPDHLSSTSSLQNVTVSIYPSPTIPKTFTTFNTDTITGGGTYSKSLDVTGLAADDYLFYTVTADYTALSGDAYSSDILMAFSNGDAISYTNQQQALQGFLSSSASTTLYWSGLFQRKYAGGGALTILFKDNFTSSYTSQLTNVKVTIYRGAGTGVTAIHLTDLKASTEKDYLPFILAGLVVSVGLIPSIKRRLLERRLDTDR